MVCVDRVQRGMPLPLPSCVVAHGRKMKKKGEKEIREKRKKKE